MYKNKGTKRAESAGSGFLQQPLIIQFLTLIILLTCFISFGCTASPTNSNSPSNSNVIMNSNTSVSTNANTTATANMNSNASAGVSSSAFSAKEPEKYSLTMAISGQGSASNKQGSLPPQTIEFAKIGVDRRWGINLPTIGQVAYLEKAGLRYLLLPSRNQYVEISPEELGFQLGNAMTPSAIVERLKPHTQYETVGTETINGRTATKYKFVGEADTRTKAGTVQSESYIYMDEATGLPLRADLNLASSSGGQAHGSIETRDINLNPDAKLFEVPTTFKKVTTAELKQQVQGFIQFIRLLAPMMTQQASGTPQPTPPVTPAPAQK